MSAGSKRALAPQAAKIPSSRREPAIDPPAIATLAESLERLDHELQVGGAQLPRLFLLESEYMRAMQATELAWVRSVIDELRTEQLTWSMEWLRTFAEGDLTDQLGD